MDQSASAPPSDPPQRGVPGVKRSARPRRPRPKRLINNSGTSPTDRLRSLDRLHCKSVRSVLLGRAHLWSCASLLAIRRHFAPIGRGAPWKLSARSLQLGTTPQLEWQRLKPWPPMLRPELERLQTEPRQRSVIRSASGGGYVLCASCSTLDSVRPLHEGE